MIVWLWLVAVGFLIAAILSAVLQGNFCITLVLFTLGVATSLAALIVGMAKDLQRDSNTHIE